MKELPIVAIVGRPNVGKSTLFNRLAGKALAIVHDAPGVTRDRNYTDTILAGREITLVDTGGFDPTTEDPMGQGIARQARAAIEEADVVLCVLDGSLPPTEPDRKAVDLLRRSTKPVIFVANKIDGTAQEWALSDHYSLGIADFVSVSALHGRHTGKLEAALAAALPAAAKAPDDAGSERSGDDILRVAFLGRPNAGKSSLFNRLSGSERSLVDGRPGTTRDPVDSEIVFKGKRYVIVDTAGVRRKSRVERGVEALSVLRSLRAIQQANVVVLMNDVTEGISDQDARLLGLSTERGRAIVVGLNKVDLLSQQQLKKAKEEAGHALHFATWTPIVGLSAKTGQGVAQLMAQIAEVGVKMNQRVTTAQLNQFFERVVAEHPPPTRSGKAPRIYYLTQSGIDPPTFVAFCSSPEHVAESYRRFIINRIRQEFGFTGVPLKLFFRGKER